MSAFTRVACQILNYRCPVASLGIVRKARCIFPDNGFRHGISTTGTCFSGGTKKPPDVKAQIFTHTDTGLHQRICSSLIGQRGENLFRIIKKSNIMFKVVPGKDNIEIIAVNAERLEKATELITQEIESIKQRMNEPVSTGGSANKVKRKITVDDLEQIFKHLVGSKGQNINRLKTEAGLFFSLRKLDDCNIGITTNNASDMEKAVEIITQEIESIKQRMNEPVSTGGSAHKAKRQITVDDLDEIFRLLIGSKGQNIERLQADLKFRIDKVDNCTLDIKTDDASDVEKAVEIITQEIESIKQRMNELVSTGGSADKARRQITVDDLDTIFGRLIGSKGQNIMHLRTEAGFHFSVSRFDDCNMEITTDNASDMEKAVEIITQEIESIKQRMNEPVSTGGSADKVKRKITVDDLDKIFGHLIGSKGQNIKRLQAGFNFNVSQFDDCNIEITTSDASDMEKAVEIITQEIESIKQRMNEPVSTGGSADKARRKITVADPDQILGRLIGSKGQNIMRLRTEAGFHFSVSRFDDCNMEITTDNASDMEKAVEIITQEIESIKQRMNEPVSTGGSADKVKRIITVDDLDKIFGHLIGSKGQNIKRLQAGFNFNVSQFDDCNIEITTSDASDMEKAVEIITQEIESIKQSIKQRMNEPVSTGGSADKAKRKITVDGLNEIFGRLIGSKGQNIKRLQAELKFRIDKVDNCLVITTDDASDMEKAVEIITEEIKSIEKQQTLTEKDKFKAPDDVDWEKVFSGDMERLGIFEKSDLFKESSRIECPRWDQLEAADRVNRKKAYHVNNFDKMIGLTEEGKLWKFPIDNDEGRTEEENVTFDEHVFLDHLIADFPKKGPVRHFMELVISGLSKNPYMTVKEKHEHIDWYRTYFTQNEHLMKEEIGDLGKMSGPPAQV